MRSSTTCYGSLSANKDDFPSTSRVPPFTWTNFGRKIQQSTPPPSRGRLLTILSIVSLSFLTINALAFLLVEFVFPENLNKVKRHITIDDDPYEDIIRHTVPFIQRWYRGRRQRTTSPNNDQQSPTLLAPTTSFKKTLPASFTRNSSRREDAVWQQSETCLETLFQKLQDLVPETSPKLVEAALQNIGLDTIPRIRHHLEDLLTQPQSTESLLFQESFGCLSRAKSVSELACAAVSHLSTTTKDVNNNGTTLPLLHHPWDLLFGTSTSPPELRYYVRDIIHYAVIFDKLGFVAYEDYATLHDIVEVLRAKDSEKEKFFERVTTSKTTKNTAQRDFLLDKYHGVTKSLEAFEIAITQNKFVARKKFLQLNILEAVLLDIQNDNLDNALAGLAIAADVTIEPKVVDNDSTGGRFLWRLGSKWAESYIAWNAAFVAGNLPPGYMNILAIPSVACSPYKSNYGDDFVAYRLISLGLALAMDHQPLPTVMVDDDDPHHDVDMKAFYESLFSSTSPSQQGQGTTNTTTSIMTDALIRDMGKSNQRNLEVRNPPSEDVVERMLYDICDEFCHNGSWTSLTDTAPIFSNGQNFKVYSGIFLWATVIMAGWGLEVYVWKVYLLGHGGWSDEKDQLWRLVVLLYPLLNATALGMATQRNYLSLVLIVPALWKFGFPETILPMHTGLLHAAAAAACSSSDTTKCQRWQKDMMCDILNSVGNTIHHGAASLVICMLLVDVLPPIKPVLSPILILLMQHWFAPLYDLERKLFVVIEVILEVFFEWTVLSELEYLHSIHWTGSLATCTMLVAHWFYFAAGFLDLLLNKGPSTSQQHMMEDITQKSEMDCNHHDAGCNSANVVSTRKVERYAEA